MSDRPKAFMPLYIGAWLSDTMHLTTLEQGAYFLLACHYWRRLPPLPSDDTELAQIAKLPLGEWVAIKPKLMAFFQLGANGYTHTKLDELLAKAIKRYARQKKASDVANEAKAKKRRRKTATDSVGESESEDSDLVPTEHKSESRRRSRRAARASGGAPPRQPTSAEAKPPPLPGKPPDATSKKWAAYREKIGEKRWGHWFADARLNGSESSLLVRTAFERTKIEETHGDELSAIFPGFSVKLAGSGKSK